MFLFVFEPDANWAYCGGVIIIMAKTFTQCQEIWFQKTGSKYGLYSTQAIADLEGEDGEDRWINTKIFGLAGCDLLTPAIVVENWNYA